VTLLIDAGPLVALADAGEPRREQLLSTIRDEAGSLVIPAPTTAEVDYMLGQRLGDQARRAFLADLAAGRFTVDCLTRQDYANVASLEARYADLRLGLADVALVALAARHDTTRILSFDERHFRAVAPLGGGTFTILPADG
jgi:uncharacterized protein